MYRNATQLNDLSTPEKRERALRVFMIHKLRLRFSYVRVVLGVVLVAAAGLKAYGLVFDPISQDSFLASPRLATAAIEIETLLGLWLLSGWWAQGARLAAQGLFGLLASVSFYLAIVGQPSCGCLGPFTVNPWFIFTFDVAAITALLAFSSCQVSEPKAQRNAETGAAVLGRSIGSSLGSLGQGFLKVGVGVAAILALTSGTLLLTFGDLNESLSWLRGESITVEPWVVQVGEGVEGEIRTFTLRLKNHKDHSVWIIGGTKVGFCNSTRNLPICLPPRESRDIEITMIFRGSTGCFQQPFRLYSNAEKQTVVTCWYAGCVRAPASR